MRIDRVAFAVAATRADMNMTQIAERSGLSRATISAIRGGKTCAPNTAAKIAAVLGISVADLCADPTNVEAKKCSIPTGPLLSG